MEPIKQLNLLKLTNTLNMIEQFIHITTSGSKFYYKDRDLKTAHRVDGPAVESADGTKFWYVDNQLHRVDGPACEWSDGTKSWYLNGVKYTEADFNAKVNPPKASCEGKTVVVDGVTYTLTKV